MTKYKIEVKSVTFCKVDEEGDLLLNKDGSVKLFKYKTHPYSNWLHELIEDAFTYSPIDGETMLQEITIDG